MSEGAATCTIDDVTIDCGDVANYTVDFRKKRSIELGGAFELRVQFKISVGGVPVHDVDCSGFCTDDQAFTEQCLEDCERHHHNTSMLKLSRAARRLETLLHTAPSTPTDEYSGDVHTQVVRPEYRALPSLEYNELTLSCAGLTLLPKQRLKMEAVTSSCGAGMATSTAGANCGQYGHRVHINLELNYICIQMSLVVKNIIIITFILQINIKKTWIEFMILDIYI